MKLRINFSVVILAALVLTGCGVTSESIFPIGQTWTLKSKNVRVALNQKAQSATVSVNGPGSYYSQESGAYLGRFKTLNRAVFSAKGNYVAINGNVGNSQNAVTRIMIVPDNAGLINLDGVAYRGQLEFVAKNGQLVIINHLGLEEYLCGVIPKETFPSWPRAALRAQAIASRSYALSKCDSAASADFDLAAPGDQLYGGQSAETSSTTAAVYDTSGVYLEFNGQTLLTFFHTCCGGATEDGVSIFPYVKTYPKGVVSPYCKDCKHYRWEYRITPSELGSKLGIGNVNAINITKRFKSGRAAEIVFLGSKGQVKKSGEELRKLVGYNLIKSTRLNVALVGNEWLFDGYGWGHGVGMCQWCSQKMAELGMSEEKILEHFYPGAVVK